MKHLAIFLLITTISLAQDSFPGAKGFGKNTTGGRNGAIIHVTNLNTSGAGSFQAAIESFGTRVVVFDISGEINYGSNAEISITSANLTIAGETAPGNGITIRGARLNIEASNVIIRHIRIRQTQGGTVDCVRFRPFTGAKSNAIVDHVSMSYGTDENLQVGYYSNVTISNCIISDNDGSGAVLLTPEAHEISFIDNAMIWSGARNPRSSESDVRYEWVNNLVYGFNSEMINSYENQVDVRGNVWENKTSGTGTYTINLSAGNTGGAQLSLTRLYHNDNMYESGSLGVDPEYNSGTVEASPIFSSGVTPRASTAVKTYILANAGARRGISGLDSYDQSLIDDVNASVSNGYNGPEYPNIGSVTRPSSDDSDGDDMLDSSEVAIWGDITTTNDPWATTNGTNISIYDAWPNHDKTRFQMVGDSGDSGSPTQPEPDTSPIKLMNKKKSANNN